MKRWSLDARSQAPLIWSHRVGREEINVRSRRTTPQPLLVRGKRNSMRAGEEPMPAVRFSGENERRFLQFADGALEDGNLCHRVAR
jgi:hypothetical protein